LREIEADMSKSTLLILILAGALLVSLFFNFDNSEVLDSILKEKEVLQKRYEMRGDSLHLAEKLLQTADIEKTKAVIQADKRADSAIAAAIKSHKLYENLRFSRARNDLQRDSILAAILSH